MPEKEVIIWKTGLLMSFLAALETIMFTVIPITTKMVIIIMKNNILITNKGVRRLVLMKWHKDAIIIHQMRELKVLLNHSR